MGILGLQPEVQQGPVGQILTHEGLREDRAGRPRSGGQ